MVSVIWYLSTAERDQYQLASLSHTINNKAHGYYELPDWPEEAPPSSVRNVEPPPTKSSVATKSKTKKVVTECHPMELSPEDAIVNAA